MSPALYVFVDESGDYARGERYVVAGCWCISDNRPRYIFDNARAGLVSHLYEDYDFESGIKELKGTHLPIGAFGDLFETFERFVYDDGTVLGPPYPWQATGQPFRFTTDSFQPTACKEILSGFMTEVDAPGALQMLSLISLLDPVFHSGFLNLSRVDSLYLVLDAEVWKRPAEEVTQVLDFSEELNIEFETRDSEKTPGIQVADLAAYTRRRNLLKGDCEEGNEFVRQRWL